MREPVDILDERDPVAGAAAFSVLLHISVIVFVIGFGIWSKRLGQVFGEPAASAGVAVAVTPVNSIPIPRREGPENPVANDSQSVVPTAPQKQEAEQRQPEKPAVTIPDQAKPKKQEQQERRKQTYTQPVPQNQIATRVPQAAVSPMYNMNTGSNGVGIGPNSPLGQRFGWYAEAVRKIVARNWATNGLSGQSAASIVNFVINRDGSIRDIRVVQTSGNPAIDNSALRAVFNSNGQLPPLPPAYTDSSAPAEFTFDLR